MKYSGFLLMCLFFVSLSAAAQGYQPALEVGAEAPEFSGTTADGSDVSLTGLLENSDHVALIFYRGNWCGYCKKHLSILQDSLQLLVDANTSVVVVTPETPEAIDKMVSETRASFDILHDVDYRIMDDYRVSYVISPETVYKYLGPVTKRTAEANGNNDGVLPVPATYLIGKDRKILWVHFDPDYKERSSVYQILKQVTP